MTAPTTPNNGDGNDSDRGANIGKGFGPGVAPVDDSSLALEALLTLREVDADTFTGASNRDPGFSSGRRRFGG